MTDRESGDRAPMTVADAAATGDRLDLLLAMRTRVAAAVSDADTPPRDLAALTRRLMDISEEIETLELALEANADRKADNAGDGGSFDASTV